MDYSKQAAPASVEKAIAALKAHGFDAIGLHTGKEALAHIQKTIPQGASVMNGASVTLEQIGFVELLKSDTHGWDNVHAAILAETDPAKQAQLRKLSVVSDVYVGSAHAVTENGEIVIASNSGSQLPHLAFTSQHVILVVSTKKVVPTLTEAFDRIETHIIPLEGDRVRKQYGWPGTAHNKTLILRAENPVMGRTVQVVFVDEDLGF